MTPLLQVDSVSVRFGGIMALDDVSISVADGAIVGLIGPNGAGKSTLFDVVTGLRRATGHIAFAGHDVSRMPTYRRARLGMRRAFQNLGLIGDETVETNLMAAQHLGAGYSGWHLAVPWIQSREEERIRARAREIAEQFGLVDHLAARVRELSFGVARFVELACVQVEQPRLMLLDEPTTGLNQREIVTLLEMLRTASAQGSTILLVAHDVRFVMDLCEHVYVLAEGQILFEGAPDEVQRSEAVIDAYLGTGS